MGAKEASWQREEQCKGPEADVNVAYSRHREKPARLQSKEEKDFKGHIVSD